MDVRRTGGVLEDSGINMEREKVWKRADIFKSVIVGYNINLLNIS